MAHTHEVPNHLNVEDTLFLGLTPRQVATFMAFASTAYGAFDQLTVAPLVVRGAAAGLILAVGLAFTVIQPGRRPLDEWAFALFAFLVTPRILGWRRPEPDPKEWRLGVPSGWVDLAPGLGWGSGSAEPDDRERARS